ncbi:MAG: RNA 2'-phosphotransferase, partial [Bacteroidota bacterium]
LKQVVTNNNKQRFAFSEDYAMIRANQGHSVQVELDLVEQRPPAILFHGTATKNVASIQEKGLLKRQRHHVHLSSDEVTALKVGRRYGQPVILKVEALQMYEQGIPFLLSQNGVWLTEYVAPKFIAFPD